MLPATQIKAIGQEITDKYFLHLIKGSSIGFLKYIPPILLVQFMRHNLCLITKKQPVAVGGIDKLEKSP